MGAIAGLVYAGGRVVLPDETAALAQAGRSRAIDGIGAWQGGPAGFVRFRHATTPEALHERQPCLSEHSGAVICFDGRLDHRDALLARLGRAGEALRDRPDDTLAVALFDAEGDGFLRHLAGDFALAIWQPRERRLLCARGPVGFRPFYYVADARRCAFATEPRVLIRGLGLERRINEGAVAEYLTQRVVTPDESLWAGIARLPQGAALEYREGRLRTWQWDESRYEDWSRRSEADHVARFNALFDEALVATTRSQTPVFAQLSGGLDSSSVVCRAAELQRGGRIAHPLTAITARFPGEPTDEGEWSGLVEDKLGIVAETVSGKAFDFEETAAWVASTLHPPLRPNSLNTLQNVVDRVSALGGRVLLSGEGGDEFLNGTHAHWSDELRRGRLDLILREAFAREGVGFRKSLKDLAYSTIGPLVRPHLRNAIERRWPLMLQPMPDWIDRDWLRRSGLADRIAQSTAGVRHSGLAANNRYGVLEMRGADFMGDTVSAYCEEQGVEYRHPMYDRKLVSFYLGASGAILYRRGVRKHLLREAMRGTLPEPIRTRRDKTEFTAPLIDGLELYFRERPISDLALVRLGWVDQRRIEEIWEAFRVWRAAGGTDARPGMPFDALWSVPTIDLWLTHAAQL